jgi:peptidoglycan/xylan/chitin deacetylase (PgdA/CDA1 family)
VRRLPLVAALVLAVALPAAPATAAPSTGAKPCRAGLVALTFDDGPAPTVTPRLLDLLGRLHVPATFFMVGERVAAAPATARLVERSGFLVANHSYRHEDMTHQTSEAIADSVRQTGAALTAAGVHPTRLVRPPYGAVDPHVLAAIRGTGSVPVLWDVDSRDWEGGDAGQIASRILAQLHPGDDVVLQHDGVGNSPSSVAAVPVVVREARRRGFCFVGLDERGRPGFPSPAVRLSATPTDRRVREGRTAHLTVTLAGEAGQDTSVRLVLRGRTASLRDDLTRPGLVVRIPAGELEATVDVPVVRDHVAEGTERFDVRLADGVGVRPARGKTTIVIEDADG